MQDRQARSLRDLRGDSNFFSCAREPERRWFLEAKKNNLMRRRPVSARFEKFLNFFFVRVECDSFILTVTCGNLLNGRENEQAWLPLVKLAAHLGILNKIHITNKLKLVRVEAKVAPILERAANE